MATGPVSQNHVVQQGIPASGPPMYVQMPPMQQTHLPPHMVHNVMPPQQMPLHGMHHPVGPGQQLHMQPQIPPEAFDQGPRQEDGLLSKFSILRSFTEKKTTRDGQTPKRRGPKPDSKPALTRRQELNRQAQRTHRERKEFYIKTLEQEVQRLREQLVTAYQDITACKEEINRLQEIINSYNRGNEFDSPNQTVSQGVSHGFDNNSIGTAAGTASIAHGTESTRFTSPPQVHPTLNLQVTPTHNSVHSGHIPAPANLGPNYDDIAIDFILKLEKPCTDHMQFLITRSNESEEASGHALMSTCPPAAAIKEHPEEQFPPRMPNLPNADLVKLLDLSKRLALDGEVTPVMAWAHIFNDERFSYLSKADFEIIRDNLFDKVRCYGFGAVLEDFEVRDAIEMAWAKKMLALKELRMTGYQGVPVLKQEC